MKANDALQDFLRQANDLLPNNETRAELESNLKSLAQGMLSRLDIVSREEFDAQKAVLLRTRQRVEELEQQLTELEQQLK